MKPAPTNQGLLDPNQLQELHNLIQRATAKVTSTTTQQDIVRCVNEAYLLGARLGQAAGQVEGYRRARNLYKRRHPSITEIVHEELRVTLEELRRHRNLMKYSTHRDKAAATNDRLMILVNLLRSEADEAVRQRDALLGLATVVQPEVQDGASP